MPEREIAGARQELRRSVEELARHLERFAAGLVPGPAPSFSGFDELWTADPWTPDGRYQVLSGRLPRPAVAGSVAELRERAAAVLAAAGWTTGTGEGEPESVRKRYEAIVYGTRDGFEVQFRLSARAVEFYGRTPVTRLYAWESPEPVVTAETVGPGYELCPECDGLGWCPTCEGRIVFLRSGSYTGYRSGCPDCRGDNVCLVCRGAGRRSC
ncbi:hypothetical protein [Streptomyces xanthii]|uniref:Uncharacterized protein n=1 Tax=Streptomyces xanthii TaxID=2768069 RepID=A0A7H1B136_9ACTN|nr:hypothetical protein [Streptomyces xanthii]QNS02441.1 hypothetical protein IAG42_01635 [Streptomyces xanthii]